MMLSNRKVRVTPPHSSRLFVGRQGRYHRRPMSKITNRDTAPRDGGSVENRLARLLDTPLLARVVPHLPPETLHQLIRYRGLEACGELVTSATPAQLTSLLDLDLWRPARPGRPGSDEQFDVDRFGEWLEVLVDTGNSVAARTVAALDTNVVVAGLSRYVRVFDPGIFEPTAQSDDEPMDRQEAMHEGDVTDVDEAMHAGSMHAGDAPKGDSSGDWLECEVGGYIVRARRADVWDAIVTLLVALDAEHGNYFHAVMQGCRRLSNSSPEIDDLDDLLLAPEQHLHDVAIERERRRSQQGYATPADARAFLQMARQPTHTRSGASVTGSMKVNPIVSGIFSSGGRSTGIVEREYAITGTPAGIVGIDVAGITLDRRARRRNRRPRIDRSSHRLAHRSRHNAGASARAARSRGHRPADSQAHALAAADGVRARQERNRVRHAQS